MMEEKRGMVDFLHTAVACFRDLPRGHIINLAQHLQQVLTSSVGYVVSARPSHLKQNIHMPFEANHAALYLLPMCMLL